MNDRGRLSPPLIDRRGRDLEAARCPYPGASAFARPQGGLGERGMMTGEVDGGAFPEDLAVGPRAWPIRSVRSGVGIFSPVKTRLMYLAESFTRLLTARSGRPLLRWSWESAGGELVRSAAGRSRVMPRPSRAVAVPAQPEGQALGFQRVTLRVI